MLASVNPRQLSVTNQASVQELDGDPNPDAIPADILQSAEPLLLKGLVADWPVVKAARESDQAAVDYLKSFYENATVGSFIGPPGGDGRVFYNAEMTDFNYRRVMLKLDQVLDELLAHEGNKDAPMFYVGSTTVDTCLPGFPGAQRRQPRRHQPARQHLARQPFARSRTFRCARQPCLHRCGAAPLHVVSAGSAAKPLRRTFGNQPGRAGHQPRRSE